MPFLAPPSAKPPNLLAPQRRDVAKATVRGEPVLTNALTTLNRSFTLTAPVGASLPQAGESIGNKPRVSFFKLARSCAEAFSRSAGEGVFTPQSHRYHKGGNPCCRPS